MKKWILITAGILTAGLAYAGYRYFKRQAALLEDYNAEPIGVKILKWTNDTAILEFTIRITNKAAIEATITNMYMDLYLNNTFVGFINNNGTVLVPGKGTADAKVQITFAPKQVLKNIISTISILMATKDVPYQLKGSVKIKSSFIGFSVPFDYTGSLKKDMIGTIPAIS